MITSTVPDTSDLPPLPLPAGVRSRRIDDVNGLSMHILEAGWQTPGRPCVLLLHGFPELAFSWRNQLLPLAQAGYHVIAPDQRGYGRTAGWDPRYDGDLASFRIPNLVIDAMALLRACGHERAAAVIGHDFGSPVAAWCALTRPDIFGSVVLMSAPFGGAPALPRVREPSKEDNNSHPKATSGVSAEPDIHVELARLPRPRKHYQWYYATREANADMACCPQGVHAFLRAYFHMKSADWADNAPHPLAAWRADSIAQLPTYYVMDLDRTMAETVAPHLPDAQAVASNRWMPDADMAVFAAEYGRTGFQGGLQWYRCSTDPAQSADLRLFAGRTIDVPATFIAGRSDWGMYQRPGALEAMEQRACSHYVGTTIVDGAGHWVQQEQPAKVNELLLAFLREHAPC